MTRTSSAPALSYDAKRELHYPKPAWRGWMHLVAFEISLIVGTLLVAQAHGLTRAVAAGIYAGTLSGLLGTSALYHRGNWGPVAHRLLQRLDHVMIFLLIAGTATPVFLLVVPGSIGVVLLSVMWTLTAIALFTHLVWMDAPEVLVGATFIGLGCVGGAALPFVWMHVGVAAFALMLAGGLLYIVGALLYHRRRPDPLPAVFGFHEVFHAFVSAGAGAHFVAIAILIM
ncbi:MAG: hemolysin III family protein [Pseudonocardiales bacterium]|nr:hemolysin III family protein [Actinomycetota bacterium]